MKINLLIGCVLITLMAFFACRKQDAVYQEFIKGGEITYAHKADSIRAHGGNSRIQITWLRGPDPDVTRAKVYWNSRADSIEVTIPDGNPLDTVKVLLADMEEGIYTFEVITFDRQGNRSVTVDLLGAVYGELYQSSLRGRILSNVYYDQSVYLVWTGGDDDLIGQEVHYKTEDGENKMLFIPVQQDTLLLPSYQSGSPIRYRSVFLPDTLAIDTFYTDFEETKFDVVLPEDSFVKKSEFKSGLLSLNTAFAVYDKRIFTKLYRLC